MHPGRRFPKKRTLETSERTVVIPCHSRSIPKADEFQHEKGRFEVEFSWCVSFASVFRATMATALRGFTPRYAPVTGTIAQLPPVWPEGAPRGVGKVERNRPDWPEKCGAGNIEGVSKGFPFGALSNCELSDGGPLDRDAAQQVRIHFVTRGRSAQVSVWDTGLRYPECASAVGCVCGSPPVRAPSCGCVKGHFRYSRSSWRRVDAGCRTAGASARGRCRKYPADRPAPASSSLPLGSSGLRTSARSGPPSCAASEDSPKGSAAATSLGSVSGEPRTTTRARFSLLGNE
jgi:hypothetical protein